MKKRLFLFLALTNIFVIYAADGIKLRAKDESEIFVCSIHMRKSAVLVAEDASGSIVHDVDVDGNEQLETLDKLLEASYNKDHFPILGELLLNCTFKKDPALVLKLTHNFGISNILERVEFFEKERITCLSSDLYEMSELLRKIKLFREKGVGDLEKALKDMADAPEGKIPFKRKEIISWKCDLDELLDILEREELFERGQISDLGHDLESDFIHLAKVRRKSWS